MKKNIILFLFCFLCINCDAQVVFGVDIHTTMEKFKSEFSKKGYKPSQTAEGQYKYPVKYAGYPNCIAQVDYNVETDSICQLTIIFPFESYDKSLDVIINLQKQFEAKYGEKKEENYSNLGLDMLIISFGEGRKIGFKLKWKKGDEELTVWYYTGASFKSNKVSISPDI